MKINLTPRKVVNWGKAGKVINLNVTPTPFNANRAQEILSTVKYGDIPSDAMTNEERAFVHAVWDTMQGSSCFMDALVRIKNMSNLGSLKI